jgi:hypothetical protein
MPSTRSAHKRRSTPFATIFAALDEERSHWEVPIKISQSHDFRGVNSLLPPPSGSFSQLYG